MRVHEITIATSEPRQVLDITGEVNKYIQEGTGTVSIFVTHTTAAITTADLDPGTDLDLLDALHSMLPERKWRHPHNPQHAPAHLLASIVGPEVSVPYAAGKLRLGTWQRIILLEFDGPRDRTILIVNHT